jgi:hypothetical protein
MAAGAWTVYSNAALSISKGSFNLSSDTYVLILVTGSYTPAPNTDHLYSDVSANELTTAGGYTVGGVVLASVTDTLTTATVTFTSANPAWTTFTAGPFRYGVIVRRAGGSLVAGDLLLCYSDLGGGSNITGAGGTLTVTINASGIFTITHSP